MRENLREARRLLETAGWSDQGGMLRNAQGQPLEIEMLFDQASLVRILGPFQKNLEKLGIRMRLRKTDLTSRPKSIPGLESRMSDELHSMPNLALHRMAAQRRSWAMREPLVGRHR